MLYRGALASAQGRAGGAEAGQALIFNGTTVHFMTEETMESEELTDVVLCYQAMGMPLDANPVQIEQAFRSLTEQYRKEMSAADPALREMAGRNQALIQEMYEKIRASITYHTVQKDFHKASERASQAVPVKRQPHSALAERRHQIHCPRCNGLIDKGLKSCPICKGAVLSKAQRMAKYLFTPKKVLLFCVIAVAASLAALRLLRPELFSHLAENARILQADK